MSRITKNSWTPAQNDALSSIVGAVKEDTPATEVIESYRQKSGDLRRSVGGIYVRVRVLAEVFGVKVGPTFFSQFDALAEKDRQKRVFKDSTGEVEAAEISPHEAGLIKGSELTRRLGVNDSTFRKSRDHFPTLKYKMSPGRGGPIYWYDPACIELLTPEERIRIDRMRAANEYIQKAREHMLGLVPEDKAVEEAAAVTAADLQPRRVIKGVKEVENVKQGAEIVPPQQESRARKLHTRKLHTRYHDLYIAAPTAPTSPAPTSSPAPSPATSPATSPAPSPSLDALTKAWRQGILTDAEYLSKVRALSSG